MTVHLDLTLGGMIQEMKAVDTALEDTMMMAAVTNCRLLAEYERKSTPLYSEELYSNIAANNSIELSWNAGSL